jgi:peptidoglycan/LPS O-acetylase OafA/YrhL
MRFAARAPSPTQAPTRLDALTGIRPFASFAVFFFHFGRPLVAAAPGPLRAAASSGFVAVSFFYVLSGFVLTIGTRRQLLDGGFVHRRFLARRVARVLPAAFVALVLLAPLALYAPWGRATGAFPADGPNPWLTLLLHATFLEAWFPSLALTWNLPAWSVSVELAFYLVFPLLARQLLSRSPRVRWTVAGLAWLASLTLTIAYVLVNPDGRVIGPDSEAFFINALKFWPPARLPELLFGVALGALYSSSWRVPRWLGPVALAFIVVVPATQLVPYPVLHNAALLPAFGALLIAVAAARGRVARALSHPLLVQLGRSGYAIYILQMPLMYVVMLATSAGLIDWRGATFFACFATLVLVVALAVRRWVETPLQARLERLLAAPATATHR